jgi:hypothetical protein
MAHRLNKLLLSSNKYTIVSLNPCNKLTTNCKSNHLLISSTSRHYSLSRKLASAASTAASSVDRGNDDFSPAPGLFNRLVKDRRVWFYLGAVTVVVGGLYYYRRYLYIPQQHESYNLALALLHDSHLFSQLYHVPNNEIKLEIGEVKSGRVEVDKINNIEFDCYVHLHNQTLRYGPYQIKFNAARIDPQAKNEENEGSSILQGVYGGSVWRLDSLQLDNRYKNKSYYYDFTHSIFQTTPQPKPIIKNSIQQIQAKNGEETGLFSTFLSGRNVMYLGAVAAITIFATLHYKKHKDKSFIKKIEEALSSNTELQKILNSKNNVPLIPIRSKTTPNFLSLEYNTNIDNNPALVRVQAVGSYNAASKSTDWQVIHSSVQSKGAAKPHSFKFKI